MSSAFARAGAALVVLVCASTAAAQGRDALAGPLHAVLEASARVDSIDNLLTVRNVRDQSFPVLRVYAGLAVHGDSAAIPRAFMRALDAAFAHTHTEARALFGPMVDSVLTGQSLTLYGELPADIATPGKLRTVYMRSSGPLGFGNAIELADTPDTTRLAGHFAGWFSVSARHRLPDALKTWARGDISVTPPAVPFFDRAYRELALTKAIVGRPCLAGSIPACREALAIVPRNDTTGVWLTESDRRERARQVLGVNLRGVDGAVPYQHCVVAKIDSTCRTIIEGRRGWIPSPTDALARARFLRRAIVRGGPAGFERVTHSTSNDVGTLLETAAGMPLDTLVAEWRRDVLGAQPVPPAPSPIEIAETLVTAAVGLGLAVRRRP